MIFIILKSCVNFQTWPKFAWTTSNERERERELFNGRVKLILVNGFPMQARRKMQGPRLWHCCSAESGIILMRIIKKLRNQYKTRDNLRIHSEKTQQIKGFWSSSISSFVRKYRVRVRTTWSPGAPRSGAQNTFFFQTLSSGSWSRRSSCFQWWPWEACIYSLSWRPETQRNYGHVWMRGENVLTSEKRCFDH